MQIEYFTKLIIKKELPSNPIKAVNTLIIYEADHNSDDKTIKQVQYRKICGDIHQILFLNKSKSEVQNLIELNSRASGYSFGFTIQEIIYIQEYFIKDLYSEPSHYTYLLFNYHPLHEKNRQAWKANQHDSDIQLQILGENLTKHLARVLNLLNCRSEELRISIDTILEENKAFESTTTPIFTLVFNSNIRLPASFNIGGLRTVVYGQLYLLNENL